MMYNHSALDIAYSKSDNPGCSLSMDEREITLIALLQCMESCIVKLDQNENRDFKIQIKLYLTKLKKKKKKLVYYIQNKPQTISIKPIKIP